jgi:apolipoprotein N-acyltransferase
MQAPSAFLVIAVGVASALLSFFGTGLHPMWWLVWFAPVPILAVAPRLSRRAVFLLATVAWLLGELNQWSYLRRGLELPFPLIAIVLFVPAIAFSVAVLAARSFFRRGSLLLTAVAFPVCWVAYEFLTEIRSPHSTFGNLAYTQMDCLPIIQIASITGIWGISFIVFLFAGTIALLFSGGGDRTQRAIVAVAVGAVVCAVFLFGEWRLRAKLPAQSVALTLIARDVPMSVYLGSEDQALQLLREYADEVRRITPAGTDAVVLPEKIGRVSESSLAEIDELFSSAAKDTQAAIVLGLVRQTPSGSFNSSRFYSADGRLQANYDKHHLLPGVEPEKSGDKRVLVAQASRRWGLQICKDMDFPKLSREYRLEGANLMLVPAWDFDLDRSLHARMAVLRAVENGFALARSARNGLLTVSDDRGRIIAETATVPGRFVSIGGKVNVGGATAFYTRTGDWFGWLCVALFVFLLAARLFSRQPPMKQA